MLRLASITLLLAGVAANADEPLLNWQEYRSEEGHFKVLMPGKVSVMRKEVPLQEKVVLHIHLVEVSKDLAFMVMFGDNHSALEASKRLQGVVDGVGGRLQFSLNTQLGPDKIPGKDFLTDTNKGQAAYRCRVYLKQDRLYQVAVISRVKQYATSPDVEKFLNSFEITP